MADIGMDRWSTSSLGWLGGYWQSLAVTQPQLPAGQPGVNDCTRGRGRRTEVGIQVCSLSTRFYTAIIFKQVLDKR